MTKRRTVHGRRARGYTVVELLVSLSVLAIGVSGIIAMESATAFSNRHAKNLSLASHIAQSWLDQLESEAGQWNSTNDFSHTLWLGQIQSTNGEWFRPEYDIDRNFGPAFDAVGSPVADESGAQFCSDLRLTWLFNQTGGSGLIRAEVRVFWWRSGSEAVTLSAPISNPCAMQIEDFADDRYLRFFHFVHLSTAVREYRSAL